VRISGCVERPLTLSLPQLRQLPQTDLVVDIHCVTRWSKLGARFSGVLLRDLLASVRPTPKAQFVSYRADSLRGHSTSLPLADAVELGTLLALQSDGKPLPLEHGGPVRVITPGRYFYKSLKWLCGMELLAEDRLGYWEAVAGYHNTADPFLEQRYMAPRLTKQEAAAILAARDFADCDLRSIEADGRDLKRLNAAGALLRDSSFCRCNLVQACFDRANLSNARFHQADLREATFRGADVEGADFSGADLRGADFSSASLFGATFICEEAPLAPCGAESPAGKIDEDERMKQPAELPVAASANEANPRGAILDATTKIAPAQIEVLTPRQAEFVRRLVRP
jgi:hypothetical protein